MFLNEYITCGGDSFVVGGSPLFCEVEKMYVLCLWKSICCFLLFLWIIVLWRCFLCFVEGVQNVVEKLLLTCGNLCVNLCCAFFLRLRVCVFPAHFLRIHCVMAVGTSPFILFPHPPPLPPSLFLNGLSYININCALLECHYIPFSSFKSTSHFYTSSKNKF